MSLKTVARIDIFSKYELLCSNYFQLEIYLEEEYAGIRKWLVNLNPEELRKPRKIVDSRGNVKTVGMMRQSIIVSPEVRVVETTRKIYPRSLAIDMRRGTCSSTASPHQRCSIGSKISTTSLAQTTGIRWRKNGESPNGFAQKSHA
jgi:hypothetical protein